LEVSSQISYSFWCKQCADSSLCSTNSIEGILNGEDVEVSEEAWKSALNTRVEQISNLKRSSTEGRAESLTAYASILMARFARDQIENHLSELLPSMLRSIRQESTEREVVAALKGMTRPFIIVCFANNPQRLLSRLLHLIPTRYTTMLPTS
jgi:hypothetical protein